MSQNGEKVEAVEVVADAKQEPGATPATHVHAEVEVPSRGIHRTFDSGSATADKRKFMAPRMDQEDNMVSDVGGTHSWGQESEENFSSQKKVLLPFETCPFLICYPEFNVGSEPPGHGEIK